MDVFSPLCKFYGGYSKKAYVTFLAGNGDYIKGVVGLAKGLRKVKSSYPLVVAILPDVPEEHREILRSQGCIVREIEPIYPPENQVQFAMAHFVINYSKLRIWNVSRIKHSISTLQIIALIITFRIKSIRTNEDRHHRFV